MKLFLLLLLGVASIARAQAPRTYYYDQKGKTTRPGEAYLYSVVTPDRADTAVFLVETFYRSTGSPAARGSYQVSVRNPEWEKLHETRVQGVLKRGVHQEFHANGNLLFEGNFVAGSGEGRHKRYYPTGKLSSEVVLYGGRAEGLVTNYYENGKISIQYRAAAGVLDGEIIEYYETGKKNRKALLKNGVMTGAVTHYDTNEKEIPAPGK